jgi:hypothetical protein
MGVSVVDSYIAHANIDHYVNLLTSQNLAARNRATIIKLMIAEEDKLGRDLEHLQFAEVRTARARDRVNYLSKLRNAFADGSAERLQAEKTLSNFKATHQLMEQFCRHMRKRVNEA